VNGSQSKFLTVTWPISQNRPEDPPFQLGQDRLTIDKLSAFGTRLGNAAETQDGSGKDPSKTDNENQIENRFVSSQAFHRTSGGHVRKITTGEQSESRILESFSPVT
jgi:hypothetical protein